MGAEVTAAERCDSHDPGRSPIDAGEDSEVGRGEAVREQRNEASKRVGALDVVRQRQAQDDEQDDAEPRTEIRAICSRHEDAAIKPESMQMRLWLALDSRTEDEATDAVLQRKESTRTEDEEWHDGFEVGLGGWKQDSRAHDGAENRRWENRPDVAWLTAQFVSIAHRAADEPRHQADRVRHVGDLRSEAGRDEYWKANERAAARNGIDRGRHEGSEGDDDDVERAHKGSMWGLPDEGRGLFVAIDSPMRASVAPPDSRLPALFRSSRPVQELQDAVGIDLAHPHLEGRGGLHRSACSNRAKAKLDPTLLQQVPPDIRL